MLHKINQKLDKVEGILIACILALASIMTFAQVFFRYVLNDSIFWAEEAILYLIIAMSFLSTSLGIRKGSHITVDLLKSCLPESLNKVFIIISAGIGILFATALLYFGGNLFFTTLGRGQLSPTLRVPIAFIYAFIPLTAMLQIIRYIDLIFSSIWSRR
ncbi:TRAP transporter small permease [Marinomonas epiphytica]